jgi:hypothetical protein
VTNSLIADHVASSTSPCGLEATVSITDYVVAEEGYCVAVRALDDKETYNQIEGADGVFRTIQKGHVIVGALGGRQALRGYCGHVPRRIAPGDILNVLNLGGIIGICTSDHPDLGPALRVEVIGAVVVQTKGAVRHARLQDVALDPAARIGTSAPLVVVSGTSMNTGKTRAAAEIVAGLTSRGYRVAAAKLTGASLMRDVRAFKERGAFRVRSFTDAGVVCSTGKNVVPTAKGIIVDLNASAPDVLVLELGDGFIGPYGVDELLLDQEIQSFTAAHVCAAGDLAGAWAADHLFRTRYRSQIATFVGPVTDNAAGCDYIRTALGVAAANAQRDGDKLAGLVAARLPAPAVTRRIARQARTADVARVRVVM